MFHNKTSFEEAQQRMVDQQLAQRGIADERVLQAMGEVPRHRFVPEDLWDMAYRDTPLPIGHDQTISQPYIVAYMTQMLHLSSDDRVLEELYTTITSDDIYVKGGFMRVVAGETSLMDTTPFRQLIEKHVTQEVLDRVAREYDAGRILIVGTTNMDYNQLWIWNMTRLAREGGPGALEKYRKILLAAASPPASE